MLASIPLSDAGYQQIQRDQEEVKDILAGKDDRLLIIVGPCSAWPKEAVLEYAAKLVKLNEKVKHAIKLIMRVYIKNHARLKAGLTGQPARPFRLS